MMKELWSKGQSDFKGKYFTMDDCKLLPLPSTDIKIIAAGQSGPDKETVSPVMHFRAS